MIINSVELSNIRSYRSEKIKFPKGSVLLSGDIGSGKSTILLAVEFALFGVKRGEFSGSSLLRNGEKEGHVQVELSIEGREVVIKRSLKRARGTVKQDNGFIVVDGVKTELTPLELKARVFSLLGYPKELLSKSKDSIFRFTVYTPQEDMKRILMDSPESRLDTLRRIFNIDKYKTIRENISVYLRELKNRKAGLEGKIADLADKKKELSEKKEEHKAIEERMKPVKQALKALEEEIEEFKKAVEDYEKKAEEQNKLKNKLSVLDNRLKDKAKAIEDNNRKKEELRKKVEGLEKEKAELSYKRMEHDEDKLEREIEQEKKRQNDVLTREKVLKEKISSVSEKISSMKEEIKEDIDSEISKIKFPEIKKQEVKDKLSSAEKEQERLKARLNRLEAEISRERETKEKVSSMDECPMCLQKVGEDHKDHISNEADEKLNKLLSEKEAINKKLSSLNLDQIKKALEEEEKKERSYYELKARLDSLKEKKKEQEQKRSSLSAYEQEKKKFEEELSSLPGIDGKKLSEMRELLAKVKEENRKKLKLESIESGIKDRKQQIKSIEDEIASLKKDIGSINRKKQEIRLDPHVEEELERRKKQLEHLREKENSFNMSLSSFEKEKESLGKWMDSINEDIKRKEESKRKISRLEMLRKWLDEYFITLMTNIERNVMARIHTEFDELFERWLSFLIEGDLTAVLDEDFTPRITQNGFDIDFGDLSGGERQSISLAYRLSLNKVLNDLIEQIKTKDIIILDEPTDGFSSEQLDKIRDILSELTVKQVIMVSHEPKVESFVGNVIRVEKEGHVSRVSHS
ncbi:MAG: AAA family ATPase [Nanobdellota archaeon]